MQQLRIKSDQRFREWILTWGKPLSYLPKLTITFGYWDSHTSFKFLSLLLNSWQLKISKNPFEELKVCINLKKHNSFLLTTYAIIQISIWIFITSILAFHLCYNKSMAVYVGCEKTWRITIGWWTWRRKSRNICLVIYLSFLRCILAYCEFHLNKWKPWAFNMDSYTSILFFWWLTFFIF